MENFFIAQYERTSWDESNEPLPAILRWFFPIEITHSAVICGPELYKRDEMVKTRLETNIDGYPLRLVFLFK